MGDITLNTNGTTTGNISTTVDMADGMGSRIFAWASHPDVYGYPVVTGQDEEGNDVTRNATPDEVQMRWLEATLRGTVVNVKRHEEKLVKEALESPQDIEVTPGAASYTPPA